MPCRVSHTDYHTDEYTHTHIHRKFTCAAVSLGGQLAAVISPQSCGVNHIWISVCVSLSLSLSLSLSHTHTHKTAIFYSYSDLKQ